MDVEQIVEHDAIVVGGHGRAGARKNWAAYVRQILFVLNMLNFGGTGLLSLSLFSRSSAAQTKRFVGTVFGPTSSAPREVPTPLVLLTVPEWNSGSFERMEQYRDLLRPKGFTVIWTSFNPSEAGTPTALETMANETRAMIRSSMIPFPPVIIAEGYAALVAQTYISSHPASGLILIDPPVTNKDVPKSIISETLPEFTYEPKFPIAVIAEEDKLTQFQSKGHRLADSPYVDFLHRDKASGAFRHIDDWLDRLGI